MVRISKNPDVRKEEIIKAARELFDKKGYEDTTMADVAKSIGISQGLPYRYFKSKTELLDAVAQSYGQEFAQMLEQITFPQGTNPKEKLDIYFQFIVDNSIKSKLFYTLNQREHEELHQRIAEKNLVSIVPLLRDLIIEGNEQREFDCPFPEESAVFLLNGLAGVQGISPISYTEGQEKMHEDMKKMLVIIYRVLGIS